MNRRQFFLSGLAGAATLTALAPRPRRAWAAPDAGALWVNVQASGGWDQALFCDPKPQLRPALSAADREIRQAGGIPYLGFADLGQPAGQGFFGRYHDRMTVFNGIDTATNNHELGARYSASGSRNDGHPCLAAQVAAVHGAALPLSFLDYGGFDATADLVAPTRLQPGQGRLLATLVKPSETSQGPYLAPSAVGLVEAAHQRRLQRQRAAARLPGVQQGLDALQRGRAAQKDLQRLVIPASTGTNAQLMDLALSAYQQGLAASVGLAIHGFDTHTDNDSGQAAVLAALFALIGHIIDEAERRSLPVVVVATSDFGRTPYYTSSGTDHWPVSSALVVQSAAARQRGLALPVDRVIGATTDGAVAQALRAVKINPQTLQPDDSGVIMTPGHLVRALRRLARIDGAPVLARYPLTVDRDLALG